MPQNLKQLLAPGAKARNLDLGALLAVSGQEGASGRIGDGGHAFGPFQLNNAGGVITGKFRGWSPQQINAWAWSPAGISYALDGIARVASGKHGGWAVDSIVRQFERPQDPNGEASRALASLGVPQPAALSRQPVSVGAQPPSAAAPTGSSFLASLIGSTNQSLGLGSSPAFASLLSGVSTQPPQTAPAAKPAAHKGGIAELLREGIGGPTHSTGPHIHAAFTDPQLELAAIRWAQQHGLHVGENPYVGGVAPVHAKNSYHDRVFPGLFNGKRLGQAIDVSGGNTSPFYNWLAGRR